MISLHPHRLNSLITFLFFLWLLPNLILITLLLGGSVHFFVFVKLAYDINTLVLPAFILCCGLGFIIAAILKQQYRRLYQYAAIYLTVAVCFFGVRIYATHIEPHRLQNHIVQLVSPKVSEPIRIVHISDIQSSHVGDYEASVFARIKEIEPDLILSTGDLMQPLSPATWDSELPKMAELLASLNPKYGIYHVYGDTDWNLRHYSDQEVGGIHRIENETVSIQAGDVTIRLLGLSNQLSETGGGDLLLPFVEESSEGDVTIILGHRPDYVLEVINQDLAIDLCLAGHCHGGQIVIPGFGPLVTFSQIPREWVRGFRQLGKTHLNVSAGIGAEHAAGLPAIRVNCPPDLTVIDLVPEE